MDSTLIGVIIVALLVIVALALFLRFVPIGLWISAYFSRSKFRSEPLWGCGSVGSSPIPLSTL